VALPFPREEVQQSWGVTDRYILLARLEGSSDRSFYLYDNAAKETDLVVGPVENAVYEAHNDGLLQFTCRGGSATCAYPFPYLLSYDPQSGEVSQHQLFVPFDRAVALGKSGRQHVIRDLKFLPTEVSWELAPAEGQVMAGGWFLPVTSITSLESKTPGLRMRIYGAELGPEAMKWDGIQLSLTPPSGGQPPYLVEIRVQTMTGADEHPAILTQGFPWGLGWSDATAVEGQSVVQIDLFVHQGSQYSFSGEPVSGEAGEGVLSRCVLRFK